MGKSSSAALNYNPVDIFAYVYNTCEYQLYAGLWKGAQATLETKAGNDWDQANLLIQLLNASGIQARFATGWVEVYDMAYLSPWLGLRGTLDDNHDMLYYDAVVWPYAPASALEHTWVEALLPTASGAYAWSAMDPSFKFKDYRQGVSDILGSVPFDLNEYVSKGSAQQELPIQYYEDKIAQYLQTAMPGTSLADVGYDGPIIRKDFTEIPSLPYTVYWMGPRYDGIANVPADFKCPLDLTLKQGETLLLEYQLIPSEVCLKRINIDYNGLTPQLKLDGQVVATGTRASQGSSVTVTVSWTRPVCGRDQQVSVTYTAGRCVAIGFDVWQYSTEMLARAEDSVNALAIAAKNGSAIDEGELIDRVLSLALTYYRWTAEKNYASLCNILHVPRCIWGVSPGFTSSDAVLHYYWDRPVAAVPYKTLIDLPCENWPYAFPGGGIVWDDIRKRRFNDVVGGFASAMENRVWEDVLGVGAISTVKSLALAVERGIPIFTIDSGNSGTYIPMLRLSPGTISAIQSEIQQGEVVTVPRDPTPLDAWTGVGYRSADSLGYGGWFISGGYSSNSESVTDGGYATSPPVADEQNWLDDEVGDEAAYYSDNGGSSGPQTPINLAESANPQSVHDPNTLSDMLDAYGNSEDSTTAGDPVNVANGNVTRDETDISLPGIGLPLAFARHYDSQISIDCGLGGGWVHSYSDYLVFSATPGVVVWYTSEGYRRVFTADGHGGYVGSSDLHGQFSATTGGYRYREKDGTVHEFNAAGKLTRIADRNGNSLTVAYDANGHLASVTDTDAPTRQLTFTWTGDHITAVSDFTGRTWTYAYDGKDLIQVTGPSDAHTPARIVQYAYYSDAPRNGLLQRIVEPDGGTTTYSYYPNRRAFEVTNAEGYTHRVYYDLYHNQTTFVDERGHSTVYTYDNSGHLTRLTQPDWTSQTYVWQGGLMRSNTDAFGNTETYGYDALGNLTRLVDRAGTETLTTYDDNPATPGYDPTFSEPLTITRPGGRVTQFGYDSHGNLTRIEDALGNVTTMTYDSCGLLLSRTRPKGALTVGDPNDYTTNYMYNFAGQVLTETTDLPATISRTYDLRGDLLSVTDANGLTMTYEYDLLGERTSIIDPGGHATTLAYDSMGNLISITDALGHCTTRAYDDMQRLVLVTNPDGTFRTYSYDGRGDRIGETDELGRATTYCYDSRDRLIETVFADGATSRTRYDGGGRVIATIDSLGNVTGFTYDPLGRLLTTTDALGHTTTNAYDAVGNLVSVTDRRGGVTTFKYDLLNRCIQTCGEGGLVQTIEYDPDGNVWRTTQYNVTGLTTVPDDPRTLPDSRKRTSQTLYDVLDRPIEQIDPMGHTSYTYYDAGGRVRRTVDARGQATLFVYDADGNLFSRTNPDGGVTTFAYDELNRQIGLTMPEGGLWQTEYNSRGWVSAEVDPLTRRSGFAYDPVGNVQRQTNADGSWIANAYDERNRLIRRDLSDDAFAEYTYDLNGNMTLGRTEATDLSLAYDKLNRRITEVLKIPADGFDTTVAYTYDAEGNLTRVARSGDAGAWSADSTYDLAGRLTGVTDSTGESAAIGYSGFGQRESITYGSGRVDTFTYDGDGNLLSVVYAGPGSLSSITYTRDSGGLPTGISEVLDGVAETLTIVNDAMGRPTAVTAANNSGRNEAFAYDRDGNLQNTGVASGVIFDGADQPVSNSGTSYSNDANGNLVGAAGADGTRTETPHDASDRILGIRQYDASGVLIRKVEYVYDALGRRVKIAEGAGETYQIFAFGNMVAKVESGLAGSARVTSYLVGPGLDDVFAANAAGSTRYLHRDVIGSVRLVTNSAGAVVASSSYSLFGRTLVKTGTNDTGLGFIARPSDAGTGLIDLRARAYDPTLARFDERDPISSLAQGMSLYTYAADRPLRMVDPTGLCSESSATENRWNWREPWEAGMLSLFMAEDASGVAARAAASYSEPALDWYEYFTRPAFNYGGDLGPKTWNEFQASTAGQFASRAEAAEGWAAYKQAYSLEGLNEVKSLPLTQAQEAAAVGGRFAEVAERRLSVVNKVAAVANVGVAWFDYAETSQRWVAGKATTTELVVAGGKAFTTSVLAPLAFTPGLGQLVPLVNDVVWNGVELGMKLSGR